MNPTINPRWKPVAFKEWQLVSDALVAGEQSVILRKGGISEGRAGFQWLHDRFFLYPSLFHEQTTRVKPDPGGRQRTLADAVPEIEGIESPVSFSVYIETLKAGRLTRWDEVVRLDPYHIWNEDIIRERFEWGDEPGISYAVVRAFSLPEPWILEDRKTFGGCRSWFGLPAGEAGGWEKHLFGAIGTIPSCGYPDWV